MTIRGLTPPTTTGETATALSLTLRRETPPNDPRPAYVVLEDGDEKGRVFRDEENGPWLTDPNVGSYNNRESAVHALTTGKPG